MKVYTKESLIKALRQIRERGWVESARPGNDGAVGNTLEDLLGIQENNLPVANAAEWELKAQRAGASALVTLFHLEPSPTAMKFVPQILLPKYGWAHKEAGKKYPSTEMSFRQTINTQGFSDRGFTVLINHAHKKLEIVFDFSKISDRHDLWKKTVLSRVGRGGLSPEPYWGFDDLFHKTATKLHNCFFVRATRRRESGQEYFLYRDILMLRQLSQEKFIKAIEDAHIYVDFDARTGHNHGTKFRIKQGIIPDLYAECTEL